MAKKTLLTLSLILICSFCGLIYFHKLSSVPSSLYADETTVGYNAYSILKTGKDEYGQTLPIAFRLFGAYTPPLFVYTLIPFIQTLGLTSFALRLPSVLSTLFLVPLVYLFVKKINLHKSKATPILASLVFGTAPWVVFSARLGYEVTLGYCLFYFGAYFLWSRTLENRVSLLGVFLLSLATYTAHTERYLVPIFLLFFALLFKKNIFLARNTKKIYLSALVLLFTQTPHFYLLTTPAFWVKNASFAAKNLQTGLWDFVSQLLTYFSPQTYFGELLSDINLQHFSPEISLFYSWQIIPALVGLIYLLSAKKTDAHKFILLLLIVSPIPGALSGHFISIQRVLPIIIPLVFLISLGLDKLIFLYKTKMTYLLVPIFCFSLCLLWRSYFVFLPNLRTVWWSFGAKEIAHFIATNPNKQIIIDNSRDQALYSPIVFYLQFSPNNFQSQFVNLLPNYYDNPPFNPVVSFANAITRPINWEKDPVVEGYLVGDPLSISKEQAEEHFLIKVQTIKDGAGKTHFEIYETNPQEKLKTRATNK